MKAEITNKLDRLFDLLAMKADKGDLLALQQKVDGHDTQLTRIQDEMDREHKHIAWRTEWRRWLIPTILSALMIAVMLFSTFFPGTSGGPSMGDDQAAALADGTHQEHEDHPWTIVIPDHPPRSDSPEYKHSRATMNRITRNVDGFYYGQAPYQDHHGGGLWLLDDDGWFLVRNLAGIEWASQFCTDPAKVDKLRVNARRIYAGFPKAVAALGIRELLDTPITDAAASPGGPTRSATRASRSRPSWRSCSRRQPARRGSGSKPRWRRSPRPRRPSGRWSRSSRPTCRRPSRPTRRPSRLTSRHWARSSSPMCSRPWPSAPDRPTRLERRRPAAGSHHGGRRPGVFSCFYRRSEW
jgi:hypothetical protein